MRISDWSSDVCSSDLLILGTRTASLTNKKFTPEFIINYDVTPDIRIYAKYTKGFKADGFDGSNPVDLTFDPETVDGYEIGMKLASYDNRFLLNVAAFRSEYQDLQVSIFTPETPRHTVQNKIGKATGREERCTSE